MGLDIVGPNGEKIEPKPESALEPKADQEQAKDGTAEKAVDPESDKSADPEPPFKFDFGRVGWMRIEVNLEACSYHQGLVDQYSGFMDRMKHQGFTLIARLANQREAVKQGLMKQQSKNGFRSFLDGLRRK